MLLSIFYSLSAFCLITIFFLVRKSEKAMNGFLWIFCSIVLFMSFNSVASELLIMVNIKATLLWMTGINFLFSFLLLMAGNLSGVRQRYFWLKIDLVWCGLISVITFLLALLFFRPTLLIAYESSDAAIHFNRAAQYSNNSVFPMGSMNFHSVNTGLIIKLVTPLIDSFNSYKVFILVDIAYFIMQAVLFYLAVMTIAGERGNRVIAFVGSLIYIAGYPFNSLIFGFCYYQTGLILILVILLISSLYEQQVINLSWLTGLLFLLISGLVNSYLLFAPVISLSLILVVFRQMNLQRTYQSRDFIWFCGIGFMIPLIVSVVYYWFLPEVSMSPETISRDGYIYKELYRDFFLFVPFLVYELIRQRKTKFKRISVFVFSALLFVQMIISFILLEKGIVSSYYYTKNNGLFWLLCLIIVFLTVMEIRQKREWRATFLLGFGMVFMVLLIPAMDWLLQGISPELNPARENELLPVYAYNMEIVEKVDEPVLRAKTQLILTARNLAVETGTGWLPIVPPYFTDGVWYQVMTGLYPEATANNRTPMFHPWEVYEDWQNSESNYLVFVDNRTNNQMLLNELIHQHINWFSNDAGFIFKK